MTNLTLFHFPGACSRVTMTALEEIGCPYDDVVVRLNKGEQNGAYRDLNPRGKIPALQIDRALLTENAAILLWLNENYPDALLLPKTPTSHDAAAQLSDLFWVSSVWHPYVRAIRMPVRWTKGDVAPVKERGLELLTPHIQELDAKFRSQPYYYGETWSILDVYFYWCYTTAEEGGLSLDAFAGILSHRAANEARPSLIAAKHREAQSLA